MPPEKFLKPYNPIEVESDIYKKWEKSGFFNPDVCVEKGITSSDAESFSIALPPPNVTGTLHMGSALMLVIEDILIRYKRMGGKKTLWIPGTDSAAIATQAKVEKIISKEENKSRYDLGREELLHRINTFAEESKTVILNQIRTMGASLDWSRYAYTMDEKRYEAVMTAFTRMYEAGLIYRGNRIVNWDPKGPTVISDDFTGSFMGKDLTIKVIADLSVEKEFGTGALGVTPAHSQMDWEIAERHGLERIQIIDEKARMMESAGPLLSGLKVLEAREKVAEFIKNEGLLEKEEKIIQNVSTAERTSGIIEPLPKLQWFINVTKPFTILHSEIPGIASGSQTTLKEIMREAVAGGGIKILPERFEKTYFHWINNLRDWCISRQIWFGHRIPVWYKGEEIYVGVTTPKEEGWIQDEDTLDTWFSSALWTFSTLGWPERTEDLKNFHPTSLLETGYDILFFWVARMILMSGFHLGQIPFHTVYLHGLVRDEKGRKISKSLGNNIDPVEMCTKYGTDAVRMSLIIGTGPGADSKMSEQKIKAYKLFANKIWNITRFVLSNSDGAPKDKPHVTPEDEKALREFEVLSTEITNDFENFRLHLAGEKIYQYVWHTFADIVIEERKQLLLGEDEEAKRSSQWLLLHILKTSLKLLHPFMPFVTEEIWGSLPNKDSDLLLVAPWPVTS